MERQWNFAWTLAGLLLLCLCTGCPHGEEEAGSAIHTSPGGQHAAARPAPADASPQVALEKCPIKGLTLPAGTTIAKLDDRWPVAWAVQFDSTAPWSAISQQVSACVTGQGWSESPVVAPAGASLRFDAPDKKMYLMLISRFPADDDPQLQDPKVREGDDYKKMKQLQATEPDYVLAIFGDAGKAAAGGKGQSK